MLNQVNDAALALRLHPPGFRLAGAFPNIEHVYLLLRGGDPMRRFLLLLLIPLSFTSLTAQDTLTAGAKVRVTTEEKRIVGYWVSLDDNQLTLTTEARDSSLVLPLASLTKWRSAGGRSRGQAGALSLG